MAGELRRGTPLGALTRSQIYVGVTCRFCVINVALGVELFLTFKGLWVLLAAALIHLAGMIAPPRESRIVDPWLGLCLVPRFKNHALWR